MTASSLDIGAIEKLIATKDLQAETYYWMRAKALGSSLEIGRVTTVFGEDPEYWTVATIGSETHHMLYDFDFIQKIDHPGKSDNATE